MDDLRWALAWESDIAAEGQGAFAGLLARAYPAHAALFGAGRSWVGARPEARIVGTVGDRPIAHLGLLRRFLRVPDRGANRLIGVVGLVAVDPDFQGIGIGGGLLAQTARVMADLALPYGFLTCLPDVVPFYRHGGWQLMEGQITRMIGNDHRPTIYRGPAMVLPVRARMSDWPHGCIVDRNGLEV